MISCKPEDFQPELQSIAHGQSLGRTNMKNEIIYKCKSRRHKNRIHIEGRMIENAQGRTDRNVSW